MSGHAVGVQSKDLVDYPHEILQTAMLIIHVFDFVLQQVLSNIKE